MRLSCNFVNVYTIAYSVQIRLIEYPLPHGTKNKLIKEKETKNKSRICSEELRRRIHEVSAVREKGLR